MGQESQEWFTVKEVAEKLRVNPETVTRLIRKKRLKALSLGGKAGYRISPEAYREFVEESSKVAAA